PDDASADSAADSDDDAVVEGTLRSPWKWEELIVESAVVGGRTRADGGARWRRRLDGLAHDYRCRIDELTREGPESARLAPRQPALPRRLRARPRRACRAAASARGSAAARRAPPDDRFRRRRRSGRLDRADRGGASSAEAGDRRRDRAPVSVVPAAGRRRDARARALGLFAQ